MFNIRIKSNNLQGEAELIIKFNSDVEHIIFLLESPLSTLSFKLQQKDISKLQSVNRDIVWRQSRPAIACNVP